MKLPFFSARSSAREYFFGLFLKENRGIGYLFARQDGKLSLLTKQEFHYSNGWENLTNDVDEVLFKMENDTKARAEKMIVFVFSHLIDERTKEIKKPYLQKIKELTRSLEIKPIGYIECYEAVSFFLQDRDGSPLTSILIELDENSVDVFIYKGGHKVHTSIIARTDDIVADLHEVFDALGPTLLPNRIILYNSSNLVEESTKIITHKWSSDLFVQIPRVEILKETDILKGCMSIFEDQLNDQGPETAAPPKDDAPEFVESEKAEEMEKEEEGPAEVLGFAIGRDVVEMNVAPPPEQETKDTGFAVTESRPAVSAVSRKKIDLKQIIGSIWNTVSRIPLRKVSGIALPLFLVLGIIAAAEFMSHKAEIHVILPSQAVEKDITSSAVIGESQPDMITIQVATSSVSLSDVRATTGKRDIGDKAQGEVTIYNFDDTDKTFDQGTQIKTDNLTFTLNDDIKVAASALTSDASAKLPGKAKVKVTASDIGPESNIDKGKRFTIGDLSSSVFFAMNESGFSGGTRKTIKTVSKKDMDDLETSIMNKAKEQQKQELAAKNNAQVTIVDSLTEYEISNPQYSKELGEETDTLNLKATVLATYYYFDNSYLNEKLKEELSKDVPSGYGLSGSNFSYTITKVVRDDSGIHLNINASAKAVKQFDKAQVAASLPGKSPGDTRKALVSVYGADDATVNVYPPIPPFNLYLPLIKKNIDLRIDSQ